MTTHNLYTDPVPAEPWDFSMAGSTRFTWEYDDGRQSLLNLYQKGKDKQWDAAKRIDWDLEVDPYDPLGAPDESIAIYGTRYWDLMSDRERQEVRRHVIAWQFSQFMHGEQGAMITAARIVETVPDLDAKFYSATQVIDEARHVETFSRFLQDKLGVVHPINDQLQQLLAETLSDSRWDMPYLGMQVLIEGLALAAFGVARDITTKPLPKQVLSYVMQDEARHVAFGRLTLRDFYRGLTTSERLDREEFVIEACYLMRDRIRGYDIWERFGIDARQAEALGDDNPFTKMFQALLFSRIVPCVKDIGLFSDRVRDVFTDLGVADMAKSDLEALMRQDEELAGQLDAAWFAREEAARRAEVDAVISDAARD